MHTIVYLGSCILWGAYAILDALLDGNSDFPVREVMTGLAVIGSVAALFLMTFIILDKNRWINKHYRRGVHLLSSVGVTFLVVGAILSGIVLCEILFL